MASYLFYEQERHLLLTCKGYSIASYTLLTVLAYFLSTNYKTEKGK
ncbi:hypothetical protein JOC93_002302 [Priestia taiwanensis]|nr:hypothetical protein [Priestia taiwanensis]